MVALTGSPKNSDMGLSFPYSPDLLSGTTGNQKLGKESRSLYFLICCPLADPTACQPVAPPEGCDPPTAVSTPDGIAANGPIRLPREAACCRGHWMRGRRRRVFGEEDNQLHMPVGKSLLAGEGGRQSNWDSSPGPAGYFCPALLLLAVRVPHVI